MALKAGTLEDFGNSMAKAMEDALGVLWLAKTGEPLTSAAQEDRRLMFVAIAQGVVRHLKDNAGPAFDVSVNVVQAGAWVTSSGSTTTISGHAHSVDVTQDSATSNKVQSTGTGAVSINTTGDLY